MKDDWHKKFRGWHREYVRQPDGLVTLRMWFEPTFWDRIVLAFRYPLDIKHTWRRH